jgi:hypothetical protein
VSDVSNAVINNPVSSIINNSNSSEFDDVSFNLSPDDEDTTDTEEISVSEEKYYKVKPVKDKISVYSRQVINNGVSDIDTNNVNSIRITNLSVFSAKMCDRNISVPEIQSQKEITKIGKQAAGEFYNCSYYSAIHNKTNYSPDENYFCIYANGFNDKCIFVYNSEEFNKPEHKKRLPRLFDAVYKMDGSIYTVVETVKGLGNTLRYWFEDKNYLTFQLRGQSLLPGISKIASKIEYKLNINQYGEVVFILENFNK